MSTRHASKGSLTAISHCRMCDSIDLDKYLNLGMQPLADEFINVNDRFSPQVYYPLEVLVCSRCGLSQLSVVIDPEILYQHDYPYESSVTGEGRRHFNDMAVDIKSRFALDSNSVVLDVGSNDGVTLSAFGKIGIKAVGIDPSQGQVMDANANNLTTFCGFWNLDSAKIVENSVGEVDVITATNVFAHVDDLRAFMLAVDYILKPYGVLVIEAPYLPNLISGLEYDTVYHEHLSYLTVKTVSEFMNSVGFSLFDVARTGIHGGSIRMFVERLEVSRSKVDPHTTIDDMIDAEKKAGVHDFHRLKSFGKSVSDHRTTLRNFLGGLKSTGKRIAGVSAPAKGSTLINYCGLGEFFEFLTEASDRKIGRLSPGARLLVMNDRALLDFSINYGVVLAWNFAEDIARRQTDFTARGGKLLRPIPSIGIISV